MNFKVTINPDDGLYKGGRFTFSFTISSNYPFNPPKILCETKVGTRERMDFNLLSRDKLQVYHPNIDLEGNVCLNILREDWKPVLNINLVIYGLQHLFLVCLASSFEIVALPDSFYFVLLCRNPMLMILLTKVDLVCLVIGTCLLMSA